MLRFSIGLNAPVLSCKYLRSGLITTLTAILLSGLELSASIYHPDGSDESGVRVEVVSGERNVRVTVRVGLRQHCLDDVDTSGGERIRRRRHVQSPDAEGVLADERQSVAASVFERFHP